MRYHWPASFIAAKERGAGQSKSGITRALPIPHENCRYEICLTLSQIVGNTITFTLVDNGQEIDQTLIEEPGQYCFTAPLSGPASFSLTADAHTQFTLGQVTLTSACTENKLVADVLSAQDYYPFGMTMPGRIYNSGDYRFGFQGQEKDDEIGGSGNSYTAEHWQYDSRLGRRWNTEPVVKPFESPYATFANNPIWFRDPNGADTTLYAQGSGEKLDTKISQSEKTPIWVVNTQAENYDANNPWATAQPLNYEVGLDSDHGGITGDDFRSNHPLCGTGACAGTQVYEEDLLDMTVEFQNVVAHGLPEFTGIARGFFPDIRFRNLVTDDAKYDLKSKITSDGTPSYAAIVIGEYSFFNGTLRRYDDYGNISYGAFGREAGFTKAYLRFGSDVNQWGKDLFGDTDGSGDEPRDVQMINLGFKLYEQGYFNQR